MYDRTAETIARVERFMATVDDAYSIPREAGVFVHALVSAIAPRLAVEIGTSYGYSALWIASAMAEAPSPGVGSRLITIDSDPRKTEVAREHIAAAGLSDRVEFRTAAALDALADIPTGVQFVLNDADKENCIAYVEALVPKLDDRAVVLTDNTRTHPDQLAAFMQWIFLRPDFVTADVPVGNGMAMSVKCNIRGIG
ncbi:MAG: class I SAM-dependent methyltransferase [Planctomycetes bacterium]|nr:class I SAM-dependent methyltransferase [Planctomycetota bacterium]